MTWAQFRQLISQHFDVEEMRTLCFDLNIDYDALRGEGKEAKVRELAALFRRNGRLPELIEVLTSMRPHVPWPESVRTGWPDRSIGGRQPIWYALGAVVILAASVFLASQLLKPEINQLQPAALPETAASEIVAETTETAVSGQIVFSRYPLDDPNQVEICIWTAVTNQVDCLKLAGRFPVWSPDGTQILFTHQGTEGVSRIYTAAVDGSDFREIPIPDSYKNPREPDWSPDSRSLIFMAGDADLYLLNIQENQISQVTTNPNYDFNPDWSPAAVTPSKILFISWYGDNPSQGIYSITAVAPSPEETRQLLFNTNSIAETVAKPIWSPTGAQLAFIYENAQIEICTMRAVTGEEPVCHEAAADYQGLTWSPDGRYIAYTAQDDTGAKIVLLDLSTEGSFLLLSQENHRIAGLSWKP